MEFGRVNSQKVACYNCSSFDAILTRSCGISYDNEVKLTKLGNQSVKSVVGQIKYRRVSFIK